MNQENLEFMKREDEKEEEERKKNNKKKKKKKKKKRKNIKPREPRISSGMQLALLFVRLAALSCLWIPAILYHNDDVTAVSLLHYSRCVQPSQPAAGDVCRKRKQQKKQKKRQKKEETWKEKKKR